MGPVDKGEEGKVASCYGYSSSAAPGWERGAGLVLSGCASRLDTQVADGGMRTALPWEVLRDVLRRYFSRSSNLCPAGETTNFPFGILHSTNME